VVARPLSPLFIASLPRLTGRQEIKGESAQLVN